MEVGDTAVEDTMMNGFRLCVVLMCEEELWGLRPDGKFIKVQKYGVKSFELYILD